MRRLIAICALLILGAEAAAEFPKSRAQEVTTPYPPVQLTRWEFDRPRPIRAWTVRIDVTNPDVELVVTPKVKVETGFHVLSQTTPVFAESNGLQLAINATHFEPLRAKSGEPMLVKGLHLSRGEVITPGVPAAQYSALLLSGENRPWFQTYPIAATELAKARNGIGGFQLAVIAGKNVVWEANPGQEKKEPRTAVGYSDGGKYLWWFIVDGRQPNRSEGMTLSELAEFALSMRVTDLLNLDGGGSTTLVMQDPTSMARNLINTPIGFGLPNTLRPNGNNLGLRFYAGPNDLTAKQLRAVMPNLPAVKVPLFLGPLNRAMARFHINTPARRAAFLAQIAHESGEMKYMEEIADGKAYDGRTDLGNTQPGDGPRFKGRGPLQLTGRENYRKAGAALDLTLEENPDRVADPEVGCMAAGWFWQSHGLNELADAERFPEITKLINGGSNGRVSRERYYEKAKSAMR